MGNPWLSTIMSVGNKAGVIPSAPQGLQNLKEAIKGVPFELLQKGMSGIMEVNNILQGVAQFAQQLGSLGQLGNFGNMLGQFQGLANSISEVASLNPDVIASKISVDQLVEAMGPNQAMMAGLTQFAPVILLQKLNTDSGVHPDVNITNINNGGVVGANTFYGNNFYGTYSNNENLANNFANGFANGTFTNNIFFSNSIFFSNGAFNFSNNSFTFSNGYTIPLPANSKLYNSRGASNNINALLDINGRTTANPNPNGFSFLDKFAANNNINSIANTILGGIINRE
jgi:hypothetical protein